MQRISWQEAQANEDPIDRSTRLRRQLGLFKPDTDGKNFTRPYGGDALSNRGWLELLEKVIPLSDIRCQANGKFEGCTDLASLDQMIGKLKGRKKTSHGEELSVTVTLTAQQHAALWDHYLPKERILKMGQGEGRTPG